MEPASFGANDRSDKDPIHRHARSFGSSADTDLDSETRSPQLATLVDLSTDRAAALERYTHGLMAPLVQLLREREAVLERKDQIIWQQAERIGRLERELELRGAREAPDVLRTPDVPRSQSPSQYTDATLGPEPEQPAIAQDLPEASAVSTASVASVASVTSVASASPTASDAPTTHLEGATSPSAEAAEPAPEEAAPLADQMVRLQAELRTIAAALEGLSLHPATTATAEVSRQDEVSFQDEVRTAAGPEAGVASEPLQAAAPPLSAPAEPMALAETTSSEDPSASAVDHVEQLPAEQDPPSTTTMVAAEQDPPAITTAVSAEELAGLFPTKGRSRLTLEPLPSQSEVEEPSLAPAPSGAPWLIGRSQEPPVQDPITEAEAAVRELQRALAPADRNPSSPGPEPRATPPPEPDKKPRRRRWFW
jgi:hypothetical protein